jgi:hypothetical protein
MATAWTMFFCSIRATGVWFQALTTTPGAFSYTAGGFPQ